MARSPQITVYPQDELKKVVDDLAAEDGRSSSAIVLKWIKERPEVQARMNGGPDGHD